MDRKALIAIALSIAILIVYQEVIRRIYPPPAPQEPGAAAPAAPEPPPLSPPGEAAVAPPVAPAQAARAPVVGGSDITVETDLYTAVFTTAGGRLRSFTLKAFRTVNAPDSPPLEMVSPGLDGELPLGVELRGGSNTVGDESVLYQASGSSLRLSGEQQGTVSLSWQSDGVRLEKRFTFTGNQYPFVLDVEPAEVPPGTSEIAVLWEKGVHGPSHQRGYAATGVVALVSNKVVRRSIDQLEKGELLTGDVAWAAYSDNYFVSALVPTQPEQFRLWLDRRSDTAEFRIMAPITKKAIPFDIYLGPKEVDLLESVGHGLNKAIDFGYFAFIAVPFLRALRLLHRVSGNYGIDIILLTVAIKILFMPLTQKSFKSMKEMQKLQPQMTKLREKFKDNPEQMNKEIMELYRRHKVNPLGGCLPMVLQIPVFIGLYNTLLNAIELRHAPFFLWITDLSQPDRLGSIQLPFVEPPGIPVLTVIMGGSMLMQQWMTPGTGDPVQQRMMMIMPLVFTFMFINFPSGLVLYWLVNNVLTITQQSVMMRRAN